MQKHLLSSLLHVAACLPSVALAETSIDLARGHFIVSMDSSVATYSLQAVARPGACVPVLTLEQQADGSYHIANTNPACQSDPYAELRLNPDWSAALHLQLDGGQIDFEPSLWEHLSTLQARVTVGDIFGTDGVQRYRLLGAKLAMDRGRTGMQLRVSVGAGQITLSTPPRRR